MKLKYVRFNGKHPSGTKGSRQYSDRPPRKGDYGVSYSPEFLKVDIDDYRKAGRE